MQGCECRGQHEHDMPQNQAPALQPVHEHGGTSYPQDLGDGDGDGDGMLQLLPTLPYDVAVLGPCALGTAHPRLALQDVPGVLVSAPLLCPMAVEECVQRD